MCKESWFVGLRAGKELSEGEGNCLNCLKYLKKIGIEKRGWKIKF